MLVSVSVAAEIIHKITSNYLCTNKAVLADRDYPPINRVMMDGIAICLENYEQGQRQFIIEDIAPAGSKIKSLKSKKCAVEVMTGSALPIGCDVVIPYEWININDNKATIHHIGALKKYDHVHLKSTDQLKADEVLKVSTNFNGPHVGITSSMGMDIKTVFSKPKIMILSTGDELVESSCQVIEDHQLRKSNVYALKASLELHGFDDLTIMHLNDDYSSLIQHYKKYAPDYDMFIYSGGVSKGKFDYLPKVWNELGVENYINGVIQKPGKPMWFGEDKKNNIIIWGLPGNPVSSLVCLHRYLLCRFPLKIEIQEDLINDSKLTKFIPVKIRSSMDAKLLASIVKIKNSGEFTALAYSDGFIQVEPDCKFQIGQTTDFYSWRSIR